MAESQDDAAVSIGRRKKSSSVAKIGTPLFLFLIVFAAYYFFHVQRKTSYFAARNLRVLATVGKQIQNRIPTAVITLPDALSSAEIAAVMKSEIADNVFTLSIVNVFDSLLVADETGRVLWQHSCHARGETPEATAVLTTLDGLMEIKGLGKDSSRKFADISRSAQNTRIMIGGREHHFFSQPLPIVVPNNRGSMQTRTWVIAGLVTRQRFMSESVSMSYTILVMILAALLLALFSIPFLKLVLVGELQRIRVSDILILGVSMFCGIAVVTIIFLDTLAYRRIRAISDAQLRRLASDIKRHARNEISRAYEVLTLLEARLPPGDDFNGKLADAARSILETRTVRQYPYFESFSRVDKTGWQRQKWFLNGTPSETIYVGDRLYYRQAMGGGGWSPDGSSRFVVDAIRSRTSGVTQAVIAKRVHAGTESDANAVVTLAFPMLSLIDPIVAGNCYFVVIDGEGNVIFHSEPQRNGIENFLVEADDNRNLQSAMYGRQNEMLNLRYWGEDWRAFTTPIDGTPWTLVTFRNKQLLRTLNVETIIITLLFLMVYVLGYALLATMIAAVRPSYRAPWIWPDRTRGYDYRRLVYAYVCFLVSFGASIYLLRPQRCWWWRSRSLRWRCSCLTSGCGARAARSRAWPRFSHSCSR